MTLMQKKGSALTKLVDDSRVPSFLAKGYEALGVNEPPEKTKAPSKEKPPEKTKNKSNKPPAREQPETKTPDNGIPEGGEPDGSENS